MNNYATTLEVIGNSNKAKGIYNEIFEIDSTFKDARINFSAILYNEKNYNEAFKSIIKSSVEPYWIREDNDIYDIQFSPDGKLLLVGSDRIWGKGVPEMYRVWDFQSRKIIKEIKGP